VTQEEEVTRIEECLRRLLKEKEEIFQERELEIASLKGELEKTVNTNMKFQKRSINLNNILKSQGSQIDNTRIVYKKEHIVEEEEFTSLEKNSMEGLKVLCPT